MWTRNRNDAERGEAFRAAAQAELDFLISLRPVKEPDASGLKALFDAVPPEGPIDD
jgi:hypothetical protein